MKKIIIKWTFRFAMTVLILLGFLIGIVLNPSLVYANKTELGSSTVYHNKPLDKNLQYKIDSSFFIFRRKTYYLHRTNL